ncbi:hypothetical protein H9Q10_04010 [Eikenella sp. S3360]|uniref:Transmembrane protein n=1 Tax=Eikenella glucosivorans TaxID=2766967 RepID=A0ABS0N949_9NEIS|nr:hypothetical protein [Eikenella glucosivorans]MBH5328830.1 hypothetical protein [Eikenella glucosivorans]
MSKFTQWMRQTRREQRRLDQALARAVFTLPAMWLILLLAAAGVGMGALVASAESHKRWQHLNTPVLYARHSGGELIRRQWYDDDDHLHITGTIRTAEGKQLNLDCRNPADLLCQYDEELWQREERLPVRRAVQAGWLNYRVITELDYSKDGIARQYRAELSPQQEAEQWRRYARGWQRAALTAWGMWLWLSVEWYRRARRQRLRRRQQ